MYVNRAAAATGSLPPGSSAGWDFIDATGAIAGAPQFRLAGRLSQGLVAACVGDKWGFIYKSGDWAITPQYDEARDFQEGLALVGIKDGAGKMSYSYIDTLGRTVFKPRRGVASASHSSKNRH